jgi:protoheme IX farnesyltransferase
MVAVTLLLTPYAGWLYGACALGLGGWFLVEAHRLRTRVAGLTTTGSPVTAGNPAATGSSSAAAGAAGAGSPTAAPMRLFHLSIAYLSLLFAVVAVTAVLPWHGV